MEQIGPFTLRTERVVGRSSEVEAIQAALADPTGRTHILYFIGPGGIGKTRLLEEVEYLVADWEPEPFLYAGIIDLYHSEFHSVGGIRAAIADGLDLENRHFQAYRERYQRFEAQRAAGVAPEVLGHERKELTRFFLTDYNRMARERRILLRFDTMELVQYESDLVQEVCQVEQGAVEVWDWLLEVLAQLEHTVVLLAGRPPAPLRTELEARCREKGGPVFRAFDLEGLTLEESLAYFDALASLEPRVGEIPEGMRRRIWTYTGGHPIRLSLVIDLALGGREIADLFPPQERDGKPAVESEEIDEQLVGELMRVSSPVREMLHYLVLARKGMDMGLLQWLVRDLQDLEDWNTLEKCRANLERMRCLTFVKPRPGTDLLFLHDKLYELFDRFVLRERQEYRRTYESIAAYYGERLVQAQDLEEQRTLKTNRLYYELQVDPWEAFWRCYVPWDEEAVRAFDTDLDMRLRDELLRFLRETREAAWVSRKLPRDVVDRDAAVRWVRRHLIRGEHQRAVEIGRRILGSDRDVFRSPDPLYRAALQTVSAEVLIYTGTDETEVMGLLDQAIQALESWQPEGEQDPRAWWQMRVLGRAYNNRGYVHWQAGRNGAAIREYKRAVRYFREAGILDEMAETLTNMSFAYAQLGYTIEAEVFLLDAIELEERLGKEYARGFSLNTLGLVYVFDNAPLQGQRRCEEALALFERLEQPRGIGLAHNALGLALRKRAEQWKVGTYSLEEAEEFFEKSTEHIGKAERIFASKVIEPVRLWETCNEMGSTYCDWGWLLLHQERTAEAQGKYDLAVEYLQKSVKVAEEHGFDLYAADSYDDLAQVCADRGAPEPEVERWLDKVRTKIPEEYELTRQGFREIADPVEGWWLALGKLHLGYGVRTMRKATEQAVSLEEKDRLLDEATDHYARAIAYLQQYSTDPHVLRVTFKSIYRHLKSVRADRLKRLQRRIADFAQEHEVDLDRLFGLLDATLGLGPPTD
jgi:tetratricopeptide (TPR) repeat protein